MKMFEEEIVTNVTPRVGWGNVDQGQCGSKAAFDITCK